MLAASSQLSRVQPAPWILLTMTASGARRSFLMRVQVEGEVKPACRAISLTE